MLGLLAAMTSVSLAAAPLLPQDAHETRERSLAPASELAELSDEALTQLSADWANLTAAERRSLLTEVKLRMARQRDARSERAPRIVATRRYGRVVRNADGDVVRIETQVVRQVIGGEKQAPAFGAGFNRRQPAPAADRAVETVIQANDSGADSTASPQTASHPQR